MPGPLYLIRGLRKRAADPPLQWIWMSGELGTTVVTKYGTKRGGVALGRMLPFGVGATIGGGVNLVMTKSVGRVILRYYAEIQPGGEMLFVPADG